jgi:hypothetical protein
VDAIEPGLDFVEAIDRALSETEVMLVVIGPKWLGEGPGARLHRPGDYVRLEIEAGLRKPDMRVIPVLVAGAEMPSGSELPEELQPLVRRNGVEMIDRRWRTDQAELVALLTRVLARAEPAAVSRPVEEPPAATAPVPARTTRDVSAPAEEKSKSGEWYVPVGWAMVAVTAVFWFAPVPIVLGALFLAPVPIVLGALTIRKGGERRRRSGTALIVAGVVVGVVSLTFYAIAAWQGWL